MDKNQLMEMKEAAEYLGVKKSTLSTWVQKHKIVPMINGNKYYFMRSDVEKFKVVNQCGLHYATDEDIQKMSDVKGQNFVGGNNRGKTCKRTVPDDMPKKENKPDNNMIFERMYVEQTIMDLEPHIVKAGCEYFEYGEDDFIIFQLRIPRNKK